MVHILSFLPIYFRSLLLFRFLVIVTSLFQKTESAFVGGRNIWLINLARLRCMALRVHVWSSRTGEDVSKMLIRWDQIKCRQYVMCLVRSNKIKSKVLNISFRMIPIPKWRSRLRKRITSKVLNAYRMIWSERQFRTYKWRTEGVCPCD